VTPQQIYQRLLAIVEALPNTKVTMTWGSPHFRVGDKIFSGWGAGQDGRYSMGAKLDKDKQAALVASDPRFEIAPYVGKHGWVSFFPGDKPDFGEIEALLLESYRAIAPKAQVAALDAGGSAAAPRGKGKATANAAKVAKPKRAGAALPSAAKRSTKTAKAAVPTKPKAKPTVKAASKPAPKPKRR
jgi:predicted DNA-binding protein (MmcQ/YjbR family)